ncbi:hypothetical protein [Gordonia sp. NPDC003585]|uniref:hypothetical protein n=1 Tax=Gordonia sp. NPDC003585 TaxID=3154275 RepID=UPI0033BF9BD6
MTDENPPASRSDEAPDTAPAADTAQAEARAPRSRLVWVLAAVVVVLLVALAGVVGYLVGSNSHDGDTTEAATTQALPIPAAPGTKLLSLRQTATRAVAESDAAARTRGQRAGWEAIKPYAEPACASMLDGLYAAFGSSSDDKYEGPTAIVSVTEDGDRGTVVTKTGTDEPETMHWIRRAGVWRFTCEGIFDQTTSESESPTTTPTTTESSEVAVVGQPCPSVGALREDATGADMHCIAADEYGPQRWAPVP